MISTSSTPNHSLILIEYLAVSTGGDGMHWTKGSSVLVFSPIRYSDLSRKLMEQLVHMSTLYVCEKSS